MCNIIKAACPACHKSKFTIGEKLCDKSPSFTHWDLLPHEYCDMLDKKKKSNECAKCKECDPGSSPSPMVQELLDYLHDFKSSIRDLVARIGLSTLEDISAETKEMWDATTTIHPHLFDSKECWRKRPTSEELVFHTLDLIEARRLAEEQDRVDDYKEYCPAYSKGLVDPSIDPRTALAQLHEPQIANPIALIGYRLLDLVPDGTLSIPEDLADFVEPLDETNLQVFLTPKYWTTDLHIDNADGFSATIGPTEKIWLMFPPTPNNLSHMQLAGAQGRKLAAIGPNLEGGLIIRTTSSDAIYIPVGCIHAVFTIHGGFLLTMEFATPKSVRALSSLLNSEFDCFKDPYSQKELPQQFIEAVNLALTTNQREIGLKAWIDMEKRVRRWNLVDLDAAKKVKERQKLWKKGIRKMWDAFFQNLQPRDMACPCGQMELGQHLKEHFRGAHDFTECMKGAAGKPRVQEVMIQQKRKRE